MTAARHDLTDPAIDMSRLWQLSSRLLDQRHPIHPGELAWRRFQHIGREPEWPTAWWELDGRIVAWGWIELPGELNLQVDPEHPELTHE
ncbi:MAG: hypothetical protein ACRD0P_37825, partial [Stackebrandtia sp.]